MANLIDVSYFIGGLNHIPQADNASVQADLNIFISYYEKDFLETILGYDLYTKFKSGLEAATPEEKWTNLKTGKEFTDRLSNLDKWDGFAYTIESKKVSPIADYIYYKYLCGKASEFTTSGEVVIKVENSSPSDGRRRQASTWNRMVKANKKLYEFMYVNQDVYPEYMTQRLSYANKCGHLYRVINSLGI